MAFGDVVSSDVVGYAETGTRTGSKIVGVQFAPVADATFTLGDLSVTGYDAEAGTEAEVNAQTLDEYGRTVGSYFFYDVPGELYGWLDINDEEANDVAIAPGSAFYVKAPNNTLSIRSAGKVITTDVSVGLRFGATLTANPTPVSVKVNDLYVTGYNTEVGTEAEVNAQKLDEYGRTVESYFFYDVPGELYGWLDINDEEVADTVTIEPGAGIYVKAPNDGLSIVFPGVTL